MYWKQRKPLSQNFLWNRELVSKLVRESSIEKKDLVIEIGPGKGVITQELIAVSRRVISVEIDQGLYTFLKNKFLKVGNLELVRENFLDYQLPQLPYKVFSNIPFVITGDIVRKLLLSTTSSTDSYLVMQKEAAGKFIVGSKNTMAAILYYPWFEIKNVFNFNRSDFIPKPAVDSCLVRICQRKSPLISNDQKDLYRDFVVYNFNRDKFAKYVPANEWIQLFKKFINELNTERVKSIEGSFLKWKTEQDKISKIHRSRTDRAWKNFR